MKVQFSADPYKMNWIRPDYEYAKVRHPSRLRAQVKNCWKGDELTTTVILKNFTDKPVLASLKDISISLPLEDRYAESRISETLRCNVQIFCGGTSSYVLARRMGGEPPHLGLILTEGSLEKYSVERNTELGSNDRGCFLLHPSAMEVLPGEERRISWVIFPCSSVEDFYYQAAHRAKFLVAQWSRYILFPSEKSTLTIHPSFRPKELKVNGISVDEVSSEDGIFSYTFEADPSSGGGEQVFEVTADEHTCITKIFIAPEFSQLVRNRCLFIADKQQYKGADDHLDGALVAYDTEEQHQYFRGGDQRVRDQDSDYNAGRERVGMGVLLAFYLETLKREKQVDISNLEPNSEEFRILRALLQYERFIERELLDVDSGHVYNDMIHDDHPKRLYNAPWFALFYLRLFGVDGQSRWLDIAVRIVRCYYEEYGYHVYPIEMPMMQMCAALSEAGRKDEEEEMKSLFLDHASVIAERGVDYPPSEVIFEQASVGSAAFILLQAYILSGDKKYVQAVQEQLKVLNTFNGIQPDYHLNEVAIRHWDDYWFGKRKVYGDTFPHYWSAISGSVFSLYSEIIGDSSYRDRAEKSLRAVIPLFFSDGSASCAYVFPYSVNGMRGEFFDEFANDQDWGLYMLLRDEQAHPRI
ncbi:MAG: hypothetical protein LKJ44_01835 [Bifidobacteriaceae bacterium]|nr:hypothetical protein [Bifidobacteriaceae bacterium]